MRIKFLQSLVHLTLALTLLISSSNSINLGNQKSDENIVTLAQTQTQAQFILGIIEMLIEHLFPLEQNQHTKIGDRHLNCIDANESKVNHSLKPHGKIKRSARKFAKAVGLPV